MNAPLARRRVARFVCGLLVASLLASLAWAATPAPAPQNQLAAQRMLIVAIAEKADPAPAVGSTPRGYAGLPNYSGSSRSIAGAARLAHDYQLHEVSAWTIASLRLRCMLYEIPPTADRDELLARLQRDGRVRLAQPLQSFDTLATPPEDGAAAAYNDPYVGLQRGFDGLDVAEAQRWTMGDNVRIAVIDTGLDGHHPDLEGRVAAERDFVGPAHPPAAAGERHGTQVAGVIAAVANNRVGIVGVAPRASLLSYRACWQLDAPAAGSRCDSFTLARALGAAIAAEPDIINLSLGGPADPLLSRLAQHAISRGIVVVGAMPPGGRQDGFPTGVAGVLAVQSSDEPATGAGPHRLAAPGRDILTLAPGGTYDFASGSSLAAAQISGSVALLRALQPGISATQAGEWLASAAAGPAPSAMASACAAVRHLRNSARCAAAPQHPPI